MRLIKYLIYCCFVLGNMANLSAQDLSKGTAALINFDVIVTKDYYKYLDDIESYSFREKIKLENTQKTVERGLLNSTFNEIKAVFKEKYNINIQKNFLKDKVYFGKDGYPSTSVKKAAKKGNADYYFSFTIFYSTKADLGSALLKTRQIKPEVSVMMTVADAKGKKIFKKIKGKAKVEKAVKAKEISGSKRVDFTETSSAEALGKPLIEVMKKAVFDLTGNFTPK